MGDYVRGFKPEDGAHYRTEHQDLGPAIRRSQLIREAEERNGTGDNDRRYVGSVPMVVVTDWLNKNGYLWEEWARNEGGIPGMMYPESKTGVKNKFMAYFMTREFSKLHTQHTTTRKASSRIIVPNNTGDTREELRRTKERDSTLV